MSNVIEILQKRGVVDAVTSEELANACGKSIKLYIGFDPTADSLHIGNLMGIVMLAWFRKFGHEPVALVGGATGRIGDPSGKSVERPLLDIAMIRGNVEKIRAQLERILGGKLLLVNNDDWFAGQLLIDFLRDVGKHFRVNQMLAKESVRARLESEEGISFTEFTYQLFQAYDFYHLFSQHNVVLQMGGSDQWGNITAGIDLIRKLTGKGAYGLTFPLLTRSDGKKLGKTESGAVWLDEKKFSPYQFYQYLFGLPDADVIKMMRFLTFMDLEEIGEYEEMMGKKDYVPNTAQKRLAEEVTRFVHGEEGLEAALRVTEAAAPGSKAHLDPKLLKEIAADMPHMTLPRGEAIDKKYVELLVKTGLVTSKGEANRLVQNGGAYLNDEKVTDVNFVVQKESLIGGEYLLVGAGKKKKILISLK